MRPLNRWKVAFFTLLVLALPTIAFLGYLFIDMAYSITYMRDGYTRTENKLERLSEVFPKQTYNKKDILHVLRQHNKEGFIVETACSVGIDGLLFEFNKANELIRIHTRADEEPELLCSSK